MIILLPNGFSFALLFHAQAGQNVKTELGFFLKKKTLFTGLNLDDATSPFVELPPDRDQTQ